MATKNNKYRRYRTLTRYQLQLVEPKQLQIVDISAFEGSKGALDTSVGGERSKSSVWLTSFKKSSIKELAYEDYLEQKEEEFVELLMQEDFSDSIRNRTTYYVGRLRKGIIYKNEVNSWLEKLYLRHQDNVLFIMQLFRLIRCFSYEYFYPSSLTLAGLGVHHSSDYVKSEALSLLDHWGNAVVFELMNYQEPPETPWLRIKYYAIRQSLERYATIQENRRDEVVR